MASLILPSRLTRQPQQAARIDWSNPITRGLVFAHTPTSLPNGSPLATRFGIAAQRPKAIPEFSEKPGSQNLPEVTLLGVALRNGTNNTASNQYFLRLRPTGNSNGTSLGIGTEPYQGMNQVRLAVQYSDFASVGITGNFPASPAAQQTVVIGTVSVAALTMNLWADGNVIATGAAQNKTLFTGATTAFMGDAGGGGDNTGIPNLLCAMWTRVLSAAEIKSITDNPWQLFAAPQRRMLVATASAPAGNSYTLPAAQGSYTITGNDAGLRVARRVIASPGAYTLTGNAATLRVARRLTAVPGAYAITGNAANLIKGTAPKSLQAAGGSYVITGRPAALRTARRLVAAPGAYAITGFSTAVPAVGTVSGSKLRFANATIMGLGAALGIVNLGPDRIQKTVALL
jgi:hypothetical protein